MRYATGLSPWCVAAVAQSGDLKVAATTAAGAANRNSRLYRPAGTREALPGTMRGTCVLRFDRKVTACRAPTKNNYARAKLRNARKIFTALAVGKHLPDGGYVGGIHERQLLKLAHTAGSLGAHQVAFAGVHAFYFAVRGDLETLFGAAMSFQLQFWFRRISWHDLKNSPSWAGLAPPH